MLFMRQISTYVISSTVLSIVCNAPILFNYTALLHIMCISVTLFSPECTLTGKYAWAVLKCAIFVFACYIHRHSYRSGFLYALFSLALASAYICVTDIKLTYGCNLSTYGYSGAFLCSVIVYVCCSRIMQLCQ